MLPARLVVYVVIGMWLWSPLGYVRVLRKVTAALCWTVDDADWRPLHYDGSIAKARARLGEAVMADLFAGCAGPAGRQGEAGVFFAGPRSRPWTAPCSTPSPRVRFSPRSRCPQVGSCRRYGWSRLPSAAPWRCWEPPSTASRPVRELVTRLLGLFAPGMLVLADRGFAPFELWREAAATGADLAWPVSASFSLPVIERLDDGRYLSQLRGRTKNDRITVRVAEHSVKDADTGFSEVFALITTLLDPLAHPALDLAGLYAARWRVEFLFKILKVELRESGAVLRSKSPAMVRRELWGPLCCYQAVRLVTAHVAARADVEVRRVKFPELRGAVRDSLATTIPPLHA